MKFTFSFLMFFVASIVVGCGTQKPQVEDLKGTLGWSKDHVESRFGRPASSSRESSKDHPGGYWVYKIDDSSGTQCTLNFDLPHRVLSANC